MRKIQKGKKGNERTKKSKGKKEINLINIMWGREQRARLRNK